MAANDGAARGGLATVSEAPLRGLIACPAWRQRGGIGCFCLDRAVLLSFFALNRKKNEKIFLILWRPEMARSRPHECPLCPSSIENAKLESEDDGP